MAKGGSFEREICKTLSGWWVQGRSDIFWRTGGSGGRARVRGRKGQATYGQSGDVCATDPIGDPFIKAFTPEIKRGYSRHTLADLLDYSSTAAIQQWEIWIEKAIECQEHAGSLSWLIIARRDKREAIAALPSGMVDMLEALGCFFDITPRFDISVAIRSKASDENAVCDVVVIRLADFLKYVQPSDICDLVRQQKRPSNQPHP